MCIYVCIYLFILKLITNLFRNLFVGYILHCCLIKRNIFRLSTYSSTCCKSDAEKKALFNQHFCESNYKAFFSLQWLSKLAHSPRILKEPCPPRLLSSFLSFFSTPPLSLPPKVLFGNGSQVFDKTVLDMTAVQSSV